MWVFLRWGIDVIIVGVGALAEWPVLNQGWLHKRGPVASYSWERRWCVLQPGLILYYTDAGLEEKKGEIRLDSSTRVLPLENGNSRWPFTVSGSSLPSGPDIKLFKIKYQPA